MAKYFNEKIWIEHAKLDRVKQASSALFYLKKSDGTLIKQY